MPAVITNARLRPDKIKLRSTSLPTVVVKRRRREAPHIGHNGAWKVAYADFVTAMMSFFLLLWLLSVTTTDQRAAISSYFDPASTADAKSGSGGVMGGKSVLEPGQKLTANTATGLQPPEAGSPDTSRRKDDENTPGDGGKQADPTAQIKQDGELAAAKQAAEIEDRHFKEAEAALKQAIQSVPETQDLARNLIVDETPEGLRIQIVDQDGQSMFPSGGIEMYDRTKKLMAMVQQSVASLPNKISIRGHTDATPYRGGGKYNNWDLSTERANASRRALEAAGLDSDRVLEVIGKADKDPLVTDKPLSAENRRISIILLREAPVPAAKAPQRK